MILGFKEQFVQPIVSGYKIHTIRVDKNKRWKPGMKIHFSTNVRTKRQYQFMSGICVNVEEIELSRNKETMIIVIRKGDKSIRSACMINDNVGVFGLLCRNDGLSPQESVEWFVPKEFDYFTGRIIHWTDSAYV